MILTAARLLTDASAPLVHDAAVAVSDGVLTYAGPRNSAPDGPVTDLGDVTLMPGLIDCHVHLCQDPGSGEVSLEMPSDDDVLSRRMIANAQRLLDAGVTTARDLGAPGTLGTRVRDLLAAAPNATPRILAANAPITVTNGHAASMGGIADGVDQVRARVKQHAEDGVDLIKVMTTGGFMTPGSHPAQARYTVDELTALVSEAHDRSLPVTTHALGVEGIERAVLAGVDCIEHCGWVTRTGTEFDPRIAEMIVSRGIAVSPTMNTACTAADYMCPWDERDAVVGNLRALIALGAIIVAGTDAGIPLVHFERYADCLDTFAEAGMTPRQAIASATSVAARVCGLADVTGRLVPGLRADVIAVDGDPTESLASLHHPRFVLADGLRHEIRNTDLGTSDSVARERIRRNLEQGAGR
ncbi:metal-dependent hydrolase family protein [Amycolatopsis nivea]|uniref:metal-dependent hydrolase family protein n=1 Tax=Amycolatopsis nivea TaxID=1644109 RepID=UPI0010706981|nr:amidohydrolase family protein [Amycolatopsis nivea]